MNKKFTLIELLVVIGIIAILAAILMPALARSREKAIQSGCTNNLKQLLIAEFAYAADYQQYFIGGKPEPANSNELQSITWVARIYDYVKETKIFLCEADENDDSDFREKYGDDNGGTYTVSYINNAGLLNTKKRYLCERPSGVMAYGPRLHAKKIDSDDDDIINDSLGAYFKYTSGGVPKSNGMHSIDYFDKNRHGFVSNFAFVDGHAEAMTFKVFEEGVKGSSSDISSGKWERESYWWGLGNP